MASLKFGPFGGMIPLLDAGSLPETAAAAVANARLARGALSPLNLTGSKLGRLYDATTKKQPPAVDLALIGTQTPPAAPALASLSPTCQPWGNGGTGTDWLDIEAYGFSTYWSGDTAVVDPISLTLLLKRCEPTADGFKIYAELDRTSLSMDADVPRTIIGPRYRFVFQNDGAWDFEYGGPSLAAELAIPAADAEDVSDPYLPGFSLDLYHNPSGAEDGELAYAKLRLADIAGPLWDADVGYTADRSHPLPGGEVVFTFALDFPDPRRRLWRFVQTTVQADGAESPPSPVSELLQVWPGERLTLTTAEPPSGGLTRLYRAGGEAGARFLLLDEISSGTSWTEAGQVPQDVELPPLGNWTASGESSEADFFEGSVLHPNGFIVAYRNTSGSGAHGELWFSDIDKYSHYPQEWVRPLAETIQATALIGATVLIFTASGVHALSGAQPEVMGLELLSADHALKSVTSLVRWGGRVFWACEDGLASSAGGPPEIVTAGLLGRAEWGALVPAAMACYVMDEGLHIESASGGTAINRRLERAEGGGWSLSEYSALTGAQPAWTSKLFYFPEPRLFEAAAVQADAAVDVAVAADGVAATTLAVTATQAATGTPASFLDANGAALALGPARRWQVTFTLKSSTAGHALRAAELLEREVVDVGEGGATLTPEQLRAGQVWLRFAKAGRFAAALAAGGSFGAARLSFCDSAGVEKFKADLDDGTPKLLTGLTGNAARGLWLLKLTTTGDAPLLAADLTLTLAAERPVPLARSLRLTHGGGGIPEWWGAVFEPQGEAWLSGLRVEHAKAGTMTLSLAVPATTATITVPAAGGLVRPATPLKAPRFSFDFGGTDDFAVREVLIEARAAQGGGAGIATEQELSLWTFTDGAELACAQLLCSDYGTGATAATLKALGDGVEQANGPAFDSGAWRRLPRAWGKHYLWELEAAAPAGQLYRVAAKPRRLVAAAPGDLALTASDPETRRWLDEDYVFGREVTFTGGWLDAPQALTLNLYPDGASTADSELIQPGEFVLDAAATCSRLGLDFGSAAQQDLLARAVVLFAREAVDVGAEGFSLTRPLRQKGYLLRFARGAGEWAASRLSDDGSVESPALTLAADGGAATSVALPAAGFAILSRALGSGAEWALSLTAGRIDRFDLVPVRDVDAPAGAIRLRGNAPGWPEWLGARLQATKGFTPASLIARASAYPQTLSWTADRGAATQIAVASAAEMEIETLTARWGCLELDFGGEDHRVDELIVLPRVEQTVEPWGIDLTGLLGDEGWLRRYLAFKDRGSFAVLRVEAEDYTGLSVALTCEGAAAWSGAIADGADIELPLTLPTGRLWRLDAAGGPIRQVRLVGRVAATLQNGLAVLKAADGRVSLKGALVRCPAPSDFAAARVLASAYPAVLVLATPEREQLRRVVSDDRPFRLPRLRPEILWRVSVEAAATIQVHEAALATRLSLLG